MNPIEQLARGLGAAPFRRIPSMDVPQPAPAIGPSPMTTATPPVMTSAETGRRARMEQALPTSQSSVGSNYKWATLKSAALIGGRTFQAGTRIAVAPAQTMTSGGGKAHTTSTVTKVWAKFGQTFDASSWIEGWIAPSLFTYTGQTATWSSQTGFGALGADATIPLEQAQKGAAMSAGLALFIGGVVGLTVGIVGTVALIGGLHEENKRQDTLRRRREAGYSY